MKAHQGWRRVRSGKASVDDRRVKWKWLHPPFQTLRERLREMMTEAASPLSPDDWRRPTFTQRYNHFAPKEGICHEDLEAALKHGSHLSLADDEEGVSPGPLPDDVLSISIMRLSEEKTGEETCYSVTLPFFCFLLPTHWGVRPLSRQTGVYPSEEARHNQGQWEKLQRDAFSLLVAERPAGCCAGGGFGYAPSPPMSRYRSSVNS